MLPRGVSMGSDLMSHNPMMGLGSQEPEVASQGQRGFRRSSLQDESLPQQVSFSCHGPSGGRATSWRRGCPRRRHIWPF